MRLFWTSVVVCLSLFASAPSEAAQPAAERIGLEVFPMAPTSRKVGESRWKRMSRIKRGELQPQYLVPFYLDEMGYPRPGTRFFDEMGRVYRHAEAVAILTRTYPEASKTYKRLQNEADQLAGLYAAQSLDNATLLGLNHTGADAVTESFTNLLRMFNTDPHNR